MSPPFPLGVLVREVVGPSEIVRQARRHAVLFARVDAVAGVHGPRYRGRAAAGSR